MIAIAGDDHVAKSSIAAHQSDHIFKACGLLVFFPSNVQDILDMGLHAFAMSRLSGVWSGMKTIQEGVESSASVSVGLLSDALESVVNLVAATATLWLLVVAARPPDARYVYGYSKAEYFASGFEGMLILVAALAIAYAAMDRLFAPQPLEQVGLGLAVSMAASAVNFGVARTLFRAAREHHSIALEADAQHLMTDVWTSAGVVVGVLAVAATGWLRLDPIIALAVAANIVVSGFRLMRRAALGLMDRALPETDQQAIRAVLARYEAQGIEFHALRTRQAAGRSFITVHVLVPGRWSVGRGHQLVEAIEADLRAALAPGASVLTHLEPIGDPASYEDEELDRQR